MSDATMLLLVCLVPLAGALIAGLAPRGASSLARHWAAVVMAATLVLAGALFTGFDGAADPRLFEVKLRWIDALGVNLHFALDGLNLYLVLLTALLFPVVLGSCWRNALGASRLFAVLLLLLEGSLLGTFLAQNLMLFFIFWEAVLIPMFILILVFGGLRSRQGAQAFFLYTLAGSVLLLAAVILLGVECWRQTGRWDFSLDVLQTLQLGWQSELFVFAAIVLACAIKCPLVPFHSWLPLAYGQAPPPATALMAGVMSKMGAFALLKLAIPLCPRAAAAAAPYLVLLAVASILYGAVLALRQEEFKSLVAYSSLSHMGYIVLGVFSFEPNALHGALLQILSHGVAVAGLFVVLGLLEERLGGAYRQLRSLSSMAPRLAVVLMLFILTSVALPLTSGFTSEFLILFGAFQRSLSLWIGGAGGLQLVAVILACSGMVLGAGYMLRFARAILFGTPCQQGPCADLNLREALVVTPLLLLILWVGIFPLGLMEKTGGAVQAVNSRANGAQTAPLASTSTFFVTGGSHGQ